MQSSHSMAKRSDCSWNQLIPCKYRTSWAAHHVSGSCRKSRLKERCLVYDWRVLSGCHFCRCLLARFRVTFSDHTNQRLCLIYWLNFFLSVGTSAHVCQVQEADLNRWITAFIFAAIDYNQKNCHLNAPPGVVCSKKWALEAFVFLTLWVQNDDLPEVLLI